MWEGKVNADYSPQTQVAIEQSTLNSSSGVAPSVWVNHWVDADTLLLLLPRFYIILHHLYKPSIFTLWHTSRDF